MLCTTLSTLLVPTSKKKKHSLSLPLKEPLLSFHIFEGCSSYKRPYCYLFFKSISSECATVLRTNISISIRFLFLTLYYIIKALICRCLYMQALLISDSLFVLSSSPRISSFGLWFVISEDKLELGLL